MSDRLQPGRPTDVVSASPEKPPAAQKGSKEAVIGGVLNKATADARANFAGEGTVDVLKNPPILEDDLGELQKKLQNECQEYLDLRESGNAILSARSRGDEAAVTKILQEQIDLIIRSCEAFLLRAEAEFALSEMDMPKIRMLIRMAYGQAGTLSTRIPKNLAGAAALQAWQDRVARQYPIAVRQLVETYRQSITDKNPAKPPDKFWLEQWIKLCSRFAPELATELAEKYKEAMQRRCEYFMNEVEKELAKEHPDWNNIGNKINTPASYYEFFPPESTIRDRAEDLKKRVEDRRKKKA